MSNATYSAIVTNETAGENLGGHRVVILASNGQAYHADSSDSVDAHKVAGITTGAITSGADGFVIRFGPMTDNAWTWAPGGPIYFNSAGVLTQTVPTSGFAMQVATAETATKIFVDLYPPIILT